MKYSASAYAKAFAAAARAGRASEETLVRNLLALVARNGDTKELPKILKEADRLVGADEGIRKITVTSARPLTEPLRENIRTIASAKDVIEEKVDASLVAGIRVTIDGERQFDAALAKKLQKMLA